MSAKTVTRNVLAWFDAGERLAADKPLRADHKVEWLRISPFVAMHAACLGAIWTGWSPVALAVAGGLYLVRMFAITGFYHRYFSHRTFSTSRGGQFVFALAGATAVQRGPLWWAAHHRQHHRHSDRPGDPHSALRDGFWWSHVGWIASKANFATDLTAVPDLARFPELRFLDRFDTLVPALLAASMFALGALLPPEFGTSGMQMTVWGFFISTVILFHATCSINSLAHRIGRQPYPTGDESRNSFALAVVTLGEGWHNNHHYHQSSTRQGFRWWEIDITYMILKGLSWVGLVWDLKEPPERVLRAGAR